MEASLKRKGKNVLVYSTNHTLRLPVLLRGMGDIKSVFEFHGNHIGGGTGYCYTHHHYYIDGI